MTLSNIYKDINIDELFLMQRASLLSFCNRLPYQQQVMDALALHRG